MKILCPVDFSESAKEGMEYACHLCKALGASLSLLYVRPSMWPEAVQLEHEVQESNNSVFSLLALYAKEIHEEFRIICDYQLKETTSTFEQSVTALGDRYDLIIMGTNRSDSSYQYIFGSHTFQVMHKAKCPVLLVPKGCPYQPLVDVIYAYDPAANPLFVTEQLRKLTAPLSAKVKVLHILEEQPSIDAIRKMEILGDVIKAREPTDASWSFDFQYAQDVPLALDHYMNTDKKGQMLALSFHDRTLTEKLFHENVIKKISMIADYPVFTFWH